MDKVLRIGSMPYLNAKPLIYGLENQPNVSLELDVPSRLADKLARGNLDVALVSSIELLKNNEYRVAPGIAIASHGPVQSICLFCKRAIQELKVVALDTSSLTAATLTKIILTKYGISPKYIRCPPDVNIAEEKADAVLLIGDTALKAVHEVTDDLLWFDLGAEWESLTGLPFVYALWLVRPSFQAEGLIELLRRAKKQGLANRRTLALDAAQRLRLSAKFCYEYLTRSIFYEAGAAELEGLLRFFQLASELQLAPEWKSLKIYDEI